MGDDRVRAVVGEARARLARIAGREALQQRAWWAVGVGSAAAACRPVLFGLAEGAPPWMGIARAAGLFAVGSAVAAGAIYAIGRRKGPSDIGAARALDDALGTPEVLASGLAFARDGRSEPVAQLARVRAAKLAETADARALFPLPSLRPRARAVGRFAAVLMLVLGVGGYEPALATALISPPTASERAAAAELEVAAAELAEQAKEAPKPEASTRPTAKREQGADKLGGAGQGLAEKAREAARAARRGDRQGALSKIEELRAAGEQRAGRAGQLGKALRKVAEALSPPSASMQAAGASPTAAQPSAGAAESMKLLADKLRSPEGGSGQGQGAGKEEQERVLERLERAAEEARRAGGEGKGGDANETARALSRAAQDLKRGDREAAAQALDQAAARAAAMEKAREAAMAEAEAVAEMLERSGLLERAVQAALLGRPMPGEGERRAGGKGDGGKDGAGEGKGQGQGRGEGKGEALRAALLARLAAMAGDTPNAEPGTGPHLADRQRSRRAALAASGSIKAPSQVGDGPRAIQALSGLGRGTEPKEAYREVFPSYDAAAEEGLADERVPAQRRAAVRRYFQAIRPE